jgi:hypothetical protein
MSHKSRKRWKQRWGIKFFLVLFSYDDEDEDGASCNLLQGIDLKPMALKERMQVLGNLSLVAMFVHSLLLFRLHPYY